MSKVNLTKENAVSIIKVAVFVGISAAVGALIATVQEQPELFGVYAPIVNIVLVTIQKAVSKD